MQATAILLLLAHISLLGAIICCTLGSSISEAAIFIKVKHASTRLLLAMIVVELFVLIIYIKATIASF